MTHVRLPRPLLKVTLRTQRLEVPLTATRFFRIASARAVLSGAQRAVETESTADALQLVTALNNAIRDARPYQSAQQRLELTKRVLDFLARV